MFVNGSNQQYKHVLVGKALGICGLSDDIHSHLNSSSDGENDLMHIGIKESVPLSRSHTISLLFTLLMDDCPEFLSAPNKMKHFIVYMEVSCHFCNHKLMMPFVE